MRTCSNLSQTKKRRKFHAIEPKRRFLEEEEEKHLENNKKEKKEKQNIKDLKILLNRYYQLEVKFLIIIL